MRRVATLTNGILLGFLLIGGVVVLWSILLGPFLETRVDNPRGVLAELRIQRGSILDSNNRIIAETRGDGTEQVRVYPIPVIGPAVGYYSFRHGTAGVEEGYDASLRGDSENDWVNVWRDLLHEPQAGRDIRLTLDADWQRAADAVLGANQGALVLLTVPDGAVRAMVSHPAYDPNRLDETFDALISDETAPLLNRATQSRYQPGLVLQPFLLATGMDAQRLSLSDEVDDPVQPVAVDGQSLSCLDGAVLPSTWAENLTAVCAHPLLSLGDEVTGAELEATFASFGLTGSPQLPIDVLEEVPAPVQDPQAVMIGQENLTVTPLQVALALAALANGGVRPAPNLVEAVQDENGGWQPAPLATPEVQVVSPASARAILQTLPRYGGRIAEYTAPAVSGPSGETVGWYLGVAPAEEPRYAVVVVVEDGNALLDAQRSGRALLNHVLTSQ